MFNQQNIGKSMRESIDSNIEYGSQKMDLLREDPFRYSLIVPAKEDLLQMFFTFHFSKRDAKNGQPYWKPRYEDNIRGMKINFNLRELVETFYGIYPSDKLTGFLEKTINITPQAMSSIEEFKQADTFYDYAFVMRFSSRSGQWDYFRLMIPGYTSAEIAEILPKKYSSKSKYSKEEIQGYSPLLKIGLKKDFLEDMKSRTGYRITEEQYFMTKIASGRKAFLDEGYDKFLSEKNITNADKIYLRFMKRWKKPIVVFDATDELNTVYLDSQKLNETYAQIIYPVFDELYPIPDCKVISPKIRAKGTVVESFLRIEEFANAFLSGALDLLDPK